MPPISQLDAIRTVLKKTDPTIAILADALDAAKRVDSDYRAAVDSRAARVAEGFMDDDAARAKDRAALAEARAAAEDASAILAEAERRHAAAVAAAEQERRRAIYDAASERSRQAAAALAKTYPKIARDVLAMLRTLAEAQHDVVMANSTLPDGFEAIADPEMTARSVPALPREIIAETEVEKWVRVDQEKPVDEEFQPLIRETRNGRGRRPDDEDDLFLRAKFRKVVYQEPAHGITPKPLAIALRLPALVGDGMLWGNPPPYGAVDPDLLAIFSGQGQPGVVLGRIAEMDAAPPAKVTPAARPTKIEWQLLGYVGDSPIRPEKWSYDRDTETPPYEKDVPARPIGTSLIGIVPSRTSGDPTPSRLVAPSGNPNRAAGGQR